MLLHRGGPFIHCAVNYCAAETGESLGGNQLMAEKQSYAVIGSGAVGGLYGAMLAKAGHDVHFLLHSDYDHVRRHGWKIDSHWGDFELPRVHAHRSVETMPACEITIVALKTVCNDLLKELLPRPTAGGGAVLVLQNGLGVEAEVAKIVGAANVFGGCCFLCSNKVGPGHIRHIDYGRIVFGPHQNSESTLAKAEQIRAELDAAGIEVRASDDLNLVRWRKLMWNIPFNGLSVALDASTDQLVGNEDSLALVRAIITEVFDAARAHDVAVDPAWIDQTIDVTKTMVPYDSSMRLDFLAGRPMELQMIFKNPIEAAKSVGVAMPKTEMLYQLLRFLESAGSGSEHPVALSD